VSGEKGTYARIDVRDLPPKERHPKIMDAFDADGYEMTKDGPERFVAALPKQ
jgi:uncharacterized protein (DUF2249 family)